MAIDIERLRSALADRYRVEREIGQGGMAIVYLAEDLKHHRQVAVKVLRPELAAVVGTERFHHEIDIAAQLTHPHILPLYDSGEGDGFLYYSMPYVEGESLRDRLEREGQLPLEEALKIACEVGDGLNYAHSHDVVHRDIKPGNILLSDSHAVISDFGIARAISVAGGERVTQTGISMGSPLYMSPEQASGDERLDGRSDIYSLACVLYEMLAGEPPFTGRTPQAVLARHMSSTMPPLQAMRDTIPEGLENAVEKALHTSPADRFSTAEQFAQAIEATAHETTLTSTARPRRPTQSRGALTLVGASLGYLIAFFVVFQVANLLTRQFGLPDWFQRTAILLMLVGLPVLAATALVQTTRRDVPASRVATALRRRLTWRGTLAGAALAFLVWAAAATGWVMLGPPGSGQSLTASSLETAGPTSADPTRIAVLYFDDFSQAGDLGYLANGLTDAVIHELGQVPALLTISRNGVRPYQDTPVTLDSIARALGAGTVIEGSVTRSGERLRVSAQITETATMTQLASLSLDRPWGDWLAIVDDVVEEIAEGLRRELGVEVRLRERRAGSANPAAWELVQRADRLRADHRPLMMAGDEETAARTLLQADSLLAEAAGLDAAWLEPIVMRGWVAADLAAMLGPTPGVYDQTWIDRGLEFAQQVLVLEPRESRALELRGTLRYRMWKASESPDPALLDSGEEDLRAAVQVNPSQARAWATLSELLHEARGEFAEAKLAASRAYDEDAFLADADEILFRLSGISLELEEVDDVIYWAEEGRRRFPDLVDFVALELAALTQGGEPDIDGAWELVDQVARLTSPQHRDLYVGIARMQVATVIARAGLADSARSVIERTRADAPDDPEQYMAYDEAHARVLLGDHDGALWALGMYLAASPQEKTYISEDPWFKDLRDDPRFQELVMP